MSPNRQSSTNQSNGLEPVNRFRRRHVLAASATAGATFLAGCAATANSDEPIDSPASSATFRLLVTDLPADIGDFDRLDVSFDSARVFEGDDESTDDGADDGEPDAGSDDQHSEGGGDEQDGEPESEREDDESGDEGNETDDGDDDPVERERGFYVLDLDGATVDLTQVVGDRAMPVFEGELSEGRYSKIELHVSDVEGIVDGEAVDVKVPSGKLQITKPFELRAGETVSFVFDINVVRRGRQRRYNLQPVISGSGVEGEDVEVEEVKGASTA